MAKSDINKSPRLDRDSSVKRGKNTREQRQPITARRVCWRALSGLDRCVNSLETVDVPEQEFGSADVRRRRISPSFSRCFAPTYRFHGQSYVSSFPPSQAVLVRCIDHVRATGSPFATNVGFE